MNFQVCCTGTEKGLWVLILWRHFAFGKVNRPYVWRDGCLLQGFERAQIYFVDYFYNEDRVNKHITKNPMYCKTAPDENITLWCTAFIAWHDVLTDKLPEKNLIFQNMLTFHHYFLLLCNTIFFLNFFSICLRGDGSWGRGVWKNEPQPNPSSCSVSQVTSAVTCKTGGKNKITLYKGEWIWFHVSILQEASEFGATELALGLWRARSWI